MFEKLDNKTLKSSIIYVCDRVRAFHGQKNITSKKSKLANHFLRLVKRSIPLSQIASRTAFYLLILKGIIHL